MLKTIGSLEVLAPKLFRTDDNKVVEVGGRAGKTVRNSFKSKESKNDKSENLTRTNIKATGKLTFLTPSIRKAFNFLMQAFIKAPILRHFDLKSHIQIEIDASSYAIGGVLSQLSTNWVTPDELNLVNSKTSESNLAKFKILIKSTNLIKNLTKSDFD